MPTQKEKKTFQQRTVEGVKRGVGETSGSKLLDFYAALQEMLGEDAFKDKPKKKKPK